MYRCAKERTAVFLITMDSSTHGFCGQNSLYFRRLCSNLKKLTRLWWPFWQKEPMMSYHFPDLFCLVEDEFVDLFVILFTFNNLACGLASKEFGQSHIFQVRITIRPSCLNSFSLPI